MSTEINQFAVMRGNQKSGNGNTSEAYVLNLKKQHEDDVMLIQELRSKLDERNNVSTSHNEGRPQASNKKSFNPASTKKSFNPVEVNRVENPVNTASGARFDEDKAGLLSAQRLDDSSLPSEGKLSKIEMFKAKMKAKASSKAVEEAEKDEGF
jgi:hypothetical protein